MAEATVLTRASRELWRRSMMSTTFHLDHLFATLPCRHKRGPNYPEPGLVLSLEQLATISHTPTELIREVAPVSPAPR